jgi:hypothetical protein
MGAPADQDVVRLSGRGRWIRIAVTLVVAGLLIAGSLWGDDDVFPFGPFHMYSSAVPLNAPVNDTEVQLVDTVGQVTILTPENTGVRRAEIEGQLGRFQQDPRLLQLLAHAYGRMHPRQSLVGDTVQIVIRWYQLSDGVMTGKFTVQVVAEWAVTS